MSLKNISLDTASIVKTSLDADPPMISGERLHSRLQSHIGQFPFLAAPTKPSRNLRLIKPAFPLPIEHSANFEHYIDFIEAEIEKVLPEDMLEALQSPPQSAAQKKVLLKLNTLLPLFSWAAPSTAPSVVYATLLCSSDWTHGVGRYLSDTLSRWLIPGKLLPLYSAQSLNFQFSAQENQDYFLHQVVIGVEDERDLSLINTNLEHLGQVVRLNILAVKHARNVMSLTKLSTMQKKIMIQENIASILERSSKEFDHNVFDQMHHFLIKLSADEKITKIKDTFAPILEQRPKIFDRDIFSEIQHFVLLFREKFAAIRELRHISRVISFQYLMRKSIQATMAAAPSERHLRVKLIKTHLQYPTGNKTVLGILVAINVLRDTELFEEKHIFEAIQHCIPRVHAIHDSYLIDRRSDDKIRVFYLEVAKNDDSPFTLIEMKDLRKQLPRELNERIENVIHPVFMPRNEEEVMRNIVILSGQLKYVHDIPQVIISFNTQTEHELSFTIILLRILHGNDVPLKELFNRSKTHHKIDDLEAKQVGLLRKKYPKEANIFTVKLDKKPFLRKDYSLDLFKARGSVSSELSRILGDIRDFNGGIFSKQHEVLHELRLSLDQNHDFLLENFFYSITPPIMQSILFPSLLRSLFLMFLEAVEHDYNKERLYYKKFHDREYLQIMIAAPTPFFKERVLEAVAELKIPTLDLACTFVEIYGVACLGYIYRTENATLRDEFCRAVEVAVSD